MLVLRAARTAPEYKMILCEENGTTVWLALWLLTLMFLALFRWGGRTALHSSHSKHSGSQTHFSPR